MGKHQTKKKETKHWCAWLYRGSTANQTPFSEGFRVTVGTRSVSFSSVRLHGTILQFYNNNINNNININKNPSNQTCLNSLTNESIWNLIELNELSRFELKQAEKNESRGCSLSWQQLRHRNELFMTECGRHLAPLNGSIGYRSSQLKYVI